MKPEDACIDPLLAYSLNDITYVTRLNVMWMTTSLYLEYVHTLRSETASLIA